MHILLADDDESVAMVARLGLRKAGFTVTVVDEGQAALDAARATAFDALVLDWNMPDVDGIDVCRQLMADPSWVKVPIVFLTAASHDGAEQEALAAGARGVIFKRFEPMSVAEQVRELIG
jgi:two-component system, OmpR family, response regulator MtrA